MPVFSNYTQPQDRPSVLPDIPLDLYASITRDVANRNEQYYQNTQNLISNSFNIPAFGKDSEILKQKEAEYLNQINQISQSGSPGDPRIKGQINAIINKMSTDQDIIPIAQRGNTYLSEMRKKEKAESEGLPYYSRSLKSLNEYYNQPNYYRSPKGVTLSAGFVGVDLAKKLTETLKDVPTEDYMGKDGFYHKRPVAGRVDMAIESIASDPRVQKQLQEEFESKYEGTSWETEGVNQIRGLQQEAIKLHQQASALGNSQVVADAEKDIQMYERMISDPQSYAEQMKATVFQSELNDWKKSQKERSMFNSTEKASEYGLKAQDLSNDLFKARYTQMLPGASSLGLTDGEYQRALKTGSITKNGQTITLSDVSKATEDYKAAESYHKAEQSALARAKVKTANLAQIGNPEIKGTEQITLGGITQSKSLWDEFVKKADSPKPKWTDGDKDAISGAIREFPELFGLTEEQAGTITGANINVNSKGAIEIKTPIFSFDVKAGNLANFSNAVTKAALGNKTTPQINNPTTSNTGAFWGKTWKLTTVGKTEYATPETQEDYDAIPKGGKYFDTEDNKVYTKQ